MLFFIRKFKKVSYAEKLICKRISVLLENCEKRQGEANLNVAENHSFLSITRSHTSSNTANRTPAIGHTIQVICQSFVKKLQPR